MSAPVLIFLAGPNGAGKTTFFEEYLEPLQLPYVNADRIGRVLRVGDREAFGVAESLRSALVEAGLSFCTETVFSDPQRAKLGLLERAKVRGFAVFLVFIGLASPVLSLARVEQRVRQGGHDVPDAKVLSNLRAAITIVDEAFLFDNSSYDEPYRIVALYERGTRMRQYPPLPRWMKGLP